MKRGITLLLLGWIFGAGITLARDSKGRVLQYVKKSFLETYRSGHPNADSCPTSIIGAHGVVEWDGYGYLADFNATNHILYYSYNTPDTSLVDSTQQGCQQFSDVMNLNQINLDRAFLSPGLQFANNNDCATIIGCGPLDDDGLVTAEDRIVFATFTVSNTVPYISKMLVDTVRYNETFNRFTFDDSFGDGFRHQLISMQAPLISSHNCNGTSCEVVLQIQEPSYDSAGASGGLYGDDLLIASHLIAGYKVVAMESSSEPADAVVSSDHWNLPIDDLNRYVPAGELTGATLTSQPIQLNVTNLDEIYFAYVPIFNSDSFCASTECTPDELQALDHLGGYINNSLAGRVASAAAHIAPINDDSILMSFEGSWNTSNVTLTWETSSEQNVAGFDIYRSWKGKHWKKLNPALIPAHGAGSEYKSRHAQKKQKSFLYKLQAVDSSGIPLQSLTTQVFPR